MSADEERAGAPDANHTSPVPYNPNREMDQDREGDVRPTDGSRAAGAGFGPQAPVPQADQGERMTPS